MEVRLDNLFYIKGRAKPHVLVEQAGNLYTGLPQVGKKVQVDLVAFFSETNLKEDVSPDLKTEQDFSIGKFDTLVENNNFY